MFVSGSSPDELDAAFQALVRDRAEGVMVQADVGFFYLRQRIAQLALAQRIPSMFGFSEFVDVGGLMSYGVDRRIALRKAAVYVDKIVKGAAPGDLPIE